MDGTRPTVSVTMALYNDARFVGQAIESVLGQTFPDFELIIVDDASTDDSREVVARYKDPRIRLLVNERNSGGAAPTRNRGIAAAAGRYLAIHDSDDISLPQRFAIQVEYLDRHPEVGVVGSPAITIDEEGVPRGTWPVPFADIDIKWGLIRGSPFVNSTVMMRRSVLAKTGPYSLDPDIVRAFVEDYDLLARVSDVSRAANLEEPLVKLRRLPTSSSQRNHEQHLVQLERVRYGVACALRGEAIASRDWCAAKKLLLSPPLSPVGLNREEVQDGLRTWLAIQRGLYARYSIPPKIRHAHARRCAWLWGKHMLALACRNNGSRDLRCRLTLLSAGMRLLGSAVAPTLS